MSPQPQSLPFSVLTGFFLNIWSLSHFLQAISPLSLLPLVVKDETILPAPAPQGIEQFSKTQFV